MTNNGRSHVIGVVNDLDEITEVASIKLPDGTIASWDDVLTSDGQPLKKGDSVSVDLEYEEHEGAVSNEIDGEYDNVPEITRVVLASE